MIGLSEIVSKSTRKSFERGKRIFETPDEVSDRRFAQYSDHCEAVAHVSSVSGYAERFETCVVFDQGMDNILDYECSCPAYYRFDGMCKHTIATALAFKDDPSSFLGFGKRSIRPSSKAIASLLELAAPSPHSQVISGKARLHVSIREEYGNWSLSMRISDEKHSYVVPSPSRFAHSFMAHAFVSYGKRLAFAHTADAFEPKSAKVASALASIIQSRMERTGEDRSWDGDGASSSTADLAITSSKMMDLDEAEMVRLLLALRDLPFDFESIEAKLAIKNALWTSEVPPIELELVSSRSDDAHDAKGNGSLDGYILRSSKDAIIASSADGIFAVVDSTMYKCPPSFAPVAKVLSAMHTDGSDSQFISAEDIERFCIVVLPLLQKAVRIRKPPEIERLERLEAQARFYLDCESINGERFITLEVKMSYGDSLISLAGPPSQGRKAHATISDSLRDPYAESQAIDTAKDALNSQLIAELESDDVIHLIDDGLEEMRRVGDVYTSKDFDNLFKLRAPKMQIGLSIKGNLLELDIKAGDLPPDELQSLLSSLKRKKRFHKLKGGKIVYLDNEANISAEQMLEEMDVRPVAIKDGKASVPAYKIVFAASHGADVSLADSAKGYLCRLDDHKHATRTAPKGLQASLRPYQLDGLDWICALSELGLGGILADEMGLGKTIQAIAAIQSAIEGNERMANLIVCPASLVFNWRDEFSRFAPDVKVQVVDGTKAQRAVQIASMKADVMICSYDIARIDISEFSKREFGYMFADEGQYIKNRATKTARALRRIQAASKFVLTGTPVENRLSDLWSLMDFAIPGLLGSYARFEVTFEQDIIGGDEQAAQRLKEAISPFVMRRLKRDVLKELPEKIESVITVAMSPRQRKVYDAIEQDIRQRLAAGRDGKEAKRGQRIEILAELTKLRQVALDPSLVFENMESASSKTEAIMDLLEQSIDSGEKAIVFSQFTSYLKIIEVELEKRGIRFHKITGRTSKEDRVRRASSFEDDDVFVFLVSLKAGGTGLNLTGASIVIHADSWWNGAVVDQATDRAHRIGQKKVVNVYKIIAEGTIEQRIEELQDAKRELAESVVGQQDGNVLKSMSTEELLRLFGMG